MSPAPDSRRRQLVLATLCLALFMSMLDNVVVSNALPSISTDLHAGMTDLQWVMEGYSLMYAALLLLGGALGDRLGRRRLFLVGLTLFTGGSLVCALAGTLPILLTGRVVQGVGAALLTPQSLAFGIAEQAQKEGADIVLTGFGRALSLTQRSAKRLGVSEVLELDVTNPDHFTQLTASLKEKAGVLHGVVHAVAYAPEDALGGKFLTTPWESVATAFRVSTFSLKELTVACMPVMTEGGSVITLDFDNRVAWPIYDWMGVCKAGLEATVRYLARDLGSKNIRVNALAAGPLSTMAAKSIPGFAALERNWGKQAPLGWAAKVHHPAVAKTAVALLSDYFPSTTGEMVHVDGGYHAVGAAPIEVYADEEEEKA